MTMVSKERVDVPGYIRFTDKFLLVDGHSARDAYFEGPRMGTYKRRDFFEPTSFVRTHRLDEKASRLKTKALGISSAPAEQK